MEILLYWQRLLRKAGIDLTKLERLTKNRKQSKEKMRGWIEHIEKRVLQKGHGNIWGLREEKLEWKETRKDDELRCMYK